MKKLLLFGGIGLAGFGLYRYFKYQVNLALNYDYKIKNFKVIEYNNDNLKVSLEYEITNNSSFEILIKEYDLKLLYKNKNFADTKNNVPFIILPNKSFKFSTEAVINLKESGSSLLPLVQEIFNNKPINVEAIGFVKVKFLGINHTINFDNDSFQYSSNLLKDLGFSSQVEKFKQKNPNFAKYFGIK